ncbi:Crp/Fnr family transcriptional regulator [Roseateles sp. DAIF2]|uniref:Crp/Fnr family transcriptional regulator n=1 Tax=Roseateles sp. DAIF2 TaxID=2714952 RepID=UPI0018A318ED|nr:Crp/Fnr family transcriptional regulator [Roseateles sp. DAIF2]QPF71781.1 Crp/Fnr family transcriptional regulator [Roseateles sp. DAIF2]
MDDDGLERALDLVLAANFPGLRPAEAALRRRLLPLLSLRRLARGRTLFAQDQPTRAFYAVLAGEVEARFTGLDGTVSVLEHVQAPKLFGLAAFAAGRPASYEALARQGSRLLVFGAEAYALLMDELPGFARALLQEFAGRYDDMLRLLEASRHRPAEERFALALAQLARERGGAADAEGWQAVAATQAELAALANLSRQTVSQLIGAAEAAGRLRRGYGRLWIRYGQASP